LKKWEQRVGKKTEKRNSTPAYRSLNLKYARKKGDPEKLEEGAHQQRGKPVYERTRAMALKKERVDRRERRNI